MLFAFQNASNYFFSPEMLKKFLGFTSKFRSGGVTLNTGIFNLALSECLLDVQPFCWFCYAARGTMAKSSQLMPLINTGNYRGGTNDKPVPTI